MGGEKKIVRNILFFKLLAPNYHYVENIHPVIGQAVSNLGWEKEDTTFLTLREPLPSHSSQSIGLPHSTGVSGWIARPRRAITRHKNITLFQTGFCRCCCSFWTCYGFLGTQLTQWQQSLCDVDSRRNQITPGLAANRYHREPLAVCFLTTAAAARVSVCLSVSVSERTQIFKTQSRISSLTPPWLQFHVYHQGQAHTA